MRNAALASVAVVLVVASAGCGFLAGGDGSPPGTTSQWTTSQGTTETTTQPTDAETVRSLLESRHQKEPYGFVLEQRTVYERTGFERVVWFEGDVDAWGNVLMEGYVLTDNGSSRTKLTRRMYIHEVAGTDEWRLYSTWGGNNSLCTTERITEIDLGAEDSPVQFAYPNVSRMYEWEASESDGDVRTFEADSLSEFGREHVGVEPDAVSAELRLHTSPPRIEFYSLDATVTRNGSAIRKHETWERTGFGYRDSKELYPSWVQSSCEQPR